MTSHRASTARLLVLALLQTWLVAACEQTADAKHDSSVPTLVWHVQNLTTQDEFDFAGSGRLTGTHTDAFLVTLTAADPEGIESISLGGESSRVCAMDAIAQSIDALYAGQSCTLMPNADGNVPTEISLELSITAEGTCDEGWVWQGTTILLFGTGANFEDGMSDGMLAMDIRP
jgi:hypothetical protein